MKGLAFLWPYEPLPWPLTACTTPPAHLDVKDTVNGDRHIVLGDGCLVADRNGQLLERVHVCDPVNLITAASQQSITA